MVSQRNASSYATITGSRSSHRWWFVKKGNLKHFTNIKSLFLLVHWMAKKNELLSEWKCPEVVVRRCSVKKLFLNISENFQENTCSEVSFYQSYRSQGLSSEFCEIFNDTHRKNRVLFSSVREWLVGCFWTYWCVNTVN